MAAAEVVLGAAAIAERWFACLHVTVKLAAAAHWATG